jgi:hypothetical protein
MDDASLTISLSADIPDTRLAQLTRDLERDLSRTGIPVEAAPVRLNEGEPITLGERGEPNLLGKLTLASLTTAAVGVLIEWSKAYLSRERTLTIKVARADGTQVEITAGNVDTLAVRETLSARPPGPRDP